ncbi:MAG: ATP-dependent DNA helicase [Halobacteriales archaeon]|nr:ATP-dependent DNA helicase [Halobacteriales archaeon]
MNVDDLSDLPNNAIDLLKSSGVHTLYPPQIIAVEAGITQGKSVVASVPTASGKTFIAELAMLSTIARGGKALYIVPLRALANEKKQEFDRFDSIDISVGSSTGDYESTDDWLSTKDIIVATSEKVDSLIRNFAPWISDLTCVVADEIHLLDDASRGPTLEMTLAKLIHINPNIQIVGLSATVGNADQIATWLDATLITSTWRPISLRTGVYHDTSIHFDDGTIRDIPKKSNPVEDIIHDVLQEDGSALVFVSSRRNAESAAKKIASVTDGFTNETKPNLIELANQVRDEGETQLANTLANSIEMGSAFHHAGLVNNHRRLVEKSFRERTIKVVCATPTLAAGVNTPSRRVIVRDWRRYNSFRGGMEPLSVIEMHQMFGRAGRPNLDPYGEAILLASTPDEFNELFDRYIGAEPESIESKLAVEPALRTHILSAIATGFATTTEGLLDFLDGTLYATQTTDTRRLKFVTHSVLEYLEVNGFLTMVDGDLSATKIGEEVSRIYLDPMSAAEIIYGLKTSENPSPLGLFHLISRTPDTYPLYLKSGDREFYYQLAYESQSDFLGSSPSEFDPHWEDWLSALKTAKMIEDWTQETDEETITKHYRMGPGDIRAKIDTADWLLRAAERLALSLDLQSTSTIRNLQRRVKYGVKEELLELVAVQGVGRIRARQLFNHGIHTRSDLRTEDKQLILTALSGRKLTTEQILQNAGRTDSSLEDISPNRPFSSITHKKTSNREDEDQANLGDFK